MATQMIFRSPETASLPTAIPRSNAAPIASKPQLTATLPAGQTPGQAIAGAPASRGASLNLSPTPSITPQKVLRQTTPTLPPPSPTATLGPGPQKIGKGAAPNVSAGYIVVIDEDSGRILYEKNSHGRTPPASVTKIVTALVAIERANPSAKVKVKFDASKLVDSTLMGLQQGDEVTLEDLLYGLMLPSGNDAALAIAEYIAGSEEGFVDLMNAKVRELGLKDTQFRNPHGLDEDGHYSSAYDMTMLARYGMQHYPLFQSLAAATYWEVHGSRSWEVYNLNKLLRNYQGGDGVKIGYTDNAGRTVVGSAKRNGHRVFVTLMKAGNTLTDVTPLFDYVFDNYTWSR